MIVGGEYQKDDDVDGVPRQARKAYACCLINKIWEP